jgi:molybdopterin synthase catalytic subunit
MPGRSIPAWRGVAAHVLGDCPVGSASVVVGCNSPHRREAIRCTEYLIDELKARVPIWKKEVYEGDEEKSVWKENVEWREGRRRRVMVKVVVEEEDDDERGMKA